MGSPELLPPSDALIRAKLSVTDSHGTVISIHLSSRQPKNTSYIVISFLT
jgi:hypothetical protein